MITPRHITGEWVHVVDDGMVDEDAFPDEARPTGHVVFEPLWPDVATAGEAAYTLTPITAVIADGQLRDVQGREGVWLAGEVGAITVRWKATTYLEYKGERIPYPTLVFDLEADARLTALLQSSEPDEIPWVVDPRIEGLVAEAQQVVAEAQAAVEGLEQLEADAAGHAADAAGSASGAASSASDAAGSATAAAESASTATAQAGVATAKAGEASAAASAADTAWGEATTQAGIASDKATEATNAAELAGQYANDFDLDVSSSTGAPGSSASVTVTGEGPAYHLDFSIPEGEQGVQGPPGEVSQAQLDAAVASLVDNAPEALNTLSELATSLGNDPNFATTVSTEIGLRAKTADVDSALADKSDVGHSHAWGEVTGKPSAFPPATHSHTAADVGAAKASHTHTKGEVGLGNVDNTADADKPVSTAQQAALDAKEPTSWTGTQAQYDALGTYDADRTYYVVDA